MKGYLSDSTFDYFLMKIGLSTYQVLLEHIILLVQNIIYKFVSIFIEHLKSSCVMCTQPIQRVLLRVKAKTT